MPGPGAHIFYTLGSGLAFKHMSSSRFSSHHCVIYALNSLLGPDIGSVGEFLTKKIAPGLSPFFMNLIHHPIGYALTLGIPLAWLYSWLSWKAVLSRPGATGHKMPPDSGIGGQAGGLMSGLSFLQCLALVTAGGLSHFFLDIPFEENGKAPFFTWVLSTGFWEAEAPLYFDSAFVVGSLTLIMLFGFIHFNVPRPRKPSSTSPHVQTALLLFTSASLYCLWCTLNSYWMKDPRPPVGEEADLGVITFVSLFFLLPLLLCSWSMFPSNMAEASEKLPLWVSDSKQETQPSKH